MILKAIVERGIICQLLLVAAVGQMLCLAVNIVIKHNLKYLEKILKKKQNNNKQANINVKSRRFGIIITPFSRQNE